MAKALATGERTVGYGLRSNLLWFGRQPSHQQQSIVSHVNAIKAFLLLVQASSTSFPALLLGWGPI